MMKKIKSKILFAITVAYIHVPALALQSTNTQVEVTLQRFIDFMIGGRFTYFVLAGGMFILALGIAFGGLSKQWPSLVNWLIAGGLLFGLTPIINFFFGVNVESLIMPLLP